MSDNDNKKRKISIPELFMEDKVTPPKPKIDVNPNQIEQPQGLISVFLDESIKYDSSKEDLAMYLGGYDEPEAEDALKLYAFDMETPHTLSESCLEALCTLSRRKNKLQNFIDDCKNALLQEDLEEETVFNLEDYISFATKKL